ncbi:hypothetical protein, partial [Novosphingobium resinovorum]|uniref:hypothetical protein n=1 Tax=Novosphingobium resinovorum TaxID=158500 RepID=UPI002ECFC98C|nr:hypothetical protein [Novosphingobium resinovorum]
HKRVEPSCRTRPSCPTRLCRRPGHRIQPLDSRYDRGTDGGQVKAFLHYEGGTAYTKQDEFDDTTAEMNRRQAEGFERLGRQLNGNSWMSR